MTEIDQLVNRLKDVQDSKTRNTIFSTLFSRIAAGQENKELGSERVRSPNLADAWDASMEHLNRIVIEEGPEAAFLSAIDMALLSRGKNQQQIKVNDWIRSTGIAFLGLDDNKGRLDEYLQNVGRSQKLGVLLEKMMDNDLGKFKDFDDFYNPLGFLTIQTIYNARTQKWYWSKKQRSLYKSRIKKESPRDQNCYRHFI